MTDKVFLDYTQDELEHNYNQAAHVSNVAEIIRAYSEQSEAARKALFHSTYKYGEGSDEDLDIFPSDKAGPTLIYIHGGAWRTHNKNEFSFVAKELVPAGVNTIVLNFSKLPAVRMPDLIVQLQRALVWIIQQASNLGVDPNKLYLCGQSSGAHLAALLITSDWNRVGFQKHPISGATLLSGSYDLEPVLKTSRRSYISLSVEEEIELSPIRRLHAAIPSVLVGYAERDTKEFKRHSKEFAERLRDFDRLFDAVCLEGSNHFDEPLLLGEANGPLIPRLLKHISVSTS